MSVKLLLEPFPGTAFPPDREKGGWNTEIQQFGDHVSLFHADSKFGELSFGVRDPDGHKGWWFKEQGGGGAVTLMFSYDHNNELLVALRNEDRANMGGGRRWCVPGGFIEPGESHHAAQAREAVEEVGKNTQAAQPIAGLPYNCNRLYFVANPDEDEGIHAHSLRISFEELRMVEDGSYELTTHLPNFKEQEHVRFFYWKDAVKMTADGIALAAIARLVAQEL